MSEKRQATGTIGAMRRLGILLIAVGAVATAQIPDFGGKAQAEKMKSLEFLVGRWEGEAWAYSPRGKVALTGFEEVRVRAGGTCMIVDAEWKMKAGDREIPIHQPCAMIFYDDARKGYRMLSQLGNGLRSEFDLQVKDKGFVWTLVNPQVGEVRYTMNLSPSGEWVEIGEHKNPDGSWSKTMEMRLKKVANR